LLFFPFNLHMAYEVNPVLSFLSWPVAVFLMLAVVLAILIWRCWRRDRLVSFGLLWFLVMLLPRTNIISINRPLYEHWLYLPMLGFWLAAVVLLVRLLERRGKHIIYTVSAVVLVSLTIYFSVFTISRNRIWRDPITFYEYNLHYTPNSYIQHNNLGMAYAAEGRFWEAVEQYRLAISINDVYPQVHSNLGNALVGLGNMEEAVEEYYRAITISPTFSLPYNNLVRLAIYSKDLPALEKVISVIKENFSEDYYLKQAFFAYYYLGEYDEAKKYGSEYISRYVDQDNIGLLMLNSGR